jgi:hypothetical protein
VLFRSYQIATALFAFAAALMLLSELNGMNSMKRAYPDTLPARMEAVAGDNWSAPDNETRYLVYATDTDGQVSDFYVRYVARYFLFAAQVDAVSDFQTNTFLKEIRTYDKFVILESTPAIRAFLAAHTTLPGEPGVYDVQNTFAELAAPQP